MEHKKLSPAIERPLSPHLGSYRPQLTSVLSILHRLTGMALVAGTVALVGWLWAAAYNAEYFSAIHAFFTGDLGRLLLIGWSFAFYYHLCNGVRHLFWDIGQGFSLPVAYRSGYAVVAISIALTIGTWASVLGENGAAQ